MGSGYVIKNVGAANPIIVRDESLTQGESAALKHGDQLRIGGYLLEVAADDGPDDRTTIEPAQASSDPFALPVTVPVAASFHSDEAAAEQRAGFPAVLAVRRPRRADLRRQPVR